VTSAVAARVSARTVLCDGRELVAFVGCDYLGLSFEPRVMRAAATAIRAHGTSAAASRVTSGTSGVHLALEAGLADFLGTEASCVVSSGTLANIATLEGLAALGVRAAWIAPGAHPTLGLACPGAGIAVVIDPGDAELWCDDGVRPSEGVVMDAAGLIRRSQGRWVMIDDCHGVGVSGVGGRGAASMHEGRGRVVVTGTFSKALGSVGGWIAGPRAVIEAVRATSIAWACSTALPVYAAAASMEALGVLSGTPSLVLTLASRARMLAEGLQALGFPAHAGATPVQAIWTADPESLARVRSDLLDRGVFTVVSSYPGYPPRPCIRLSVSASHREEDLGLLCAALGDAVQGRGA
jgi:7-keto-8-aminopelargonate synthetase-like enzyme